MQRIFISLGLCSCIFTASAAISLKQQFPFRIGRRNRRRKRTGRPSRRLGRARTRNPR